MNRTLMAVLMAMMFAGCVHYQPATISTTSLGGKHEKPVRVTTGHSSAFYLFGWLGPFGNDSLQAALEDALSDERADTMINVFVDRKVISFPFDHLPLVRRIDTHVFGTLVKYTDDVEVKPQKIDVVDDPKPETPTPASPSVSEKDLSVDQIISVGELKALFAGMRAPTQIKLALKDGQAVEALFIKYIAQEEKIWIRPFDTNSREKVFSITAIKEISSINNKSGKLKIQ